MMTDVVPVNDLFYKVADYVTDGLTERLTLYDDDKGHELRPLTNRR